MRKPNYDFERAQRNMAKEAKAQEKAQKKQEQKLKDAQAASPDSGAEGTAGGGAKAPD